MKKIVRTLLVGVLAVCFFGMTMSSEVSATNRTTSEDVALRAAADFYSALVDVRTPKTSFKIYSVADGNKRNIAFVLGPDKCDFSVDRTNRRVLSFFNVDLFYNKRKIDSIRSTYYNTEEEALDRIKSYMPLASVPTDWVLSSLKVVEDSFSSGRYEPGRITAEFVPANAMVCINYKEQANFMLDPHDGSLLTFSRNSPIVVTPRSFNVSGATARNIAVQHSNRMRRIPSEVFSTKVDFIVPRVDMGRITPAGTKNAVQAWIVTFDDGSYVAVDMQDGSIVWGFI